jgi:hypothetical protein
MEVLFSPLSLLRVGKPIEDPLEVLIARKDAVFEPLASFRQGLAKLMPGVEIKEGRHAEKQRDGTVIIRAESLPVSLDIVINGFFLPSGSVVPAAYRFMINTDIIGAAIKRPEKAHNLLLDRNPSLKAKIRSLNTHDYNIDGLLTIVSITAITTYDYDSHCGRPPFTSISVLSCLSMLTLIYEIACDQFELLASSNSILFVTFSKRTAKRLKNVNVHTFFAGGSQVKVDASRWKLVEFASVHNAWLHDYTSHGTITQRKLLHSESASIQIRIHISHRAQDSNFGHDKTLVVGLLIADLIVNCIRIHLLLAGDIHPNPGPGTTTIANRNVHVVDTLRILN